MRTCPYCKLPLLPAERALTPAQDSSTARILQEVAAEHGVEPALLRSRDRHRFIVAARACAIGRLREELDLPLKTIGWLLGGRNHSTVLHYLQGKGARIVEEASRGGQD